MLSRRFSRFLLPCLFLCLCGLMAPLSFASTTDIDDIPLFLGGNGTPLNLLVMGRDHKLYYEAYNDASDLNGDSVVDVGYNPTMIDMTQKDSDGNYTIQLDYYGYFDSRKCYTYNTTNNRFVPSSVTVTKKCSNAWSGDFLNYLTTSRMDALRRVLYGGYRSTDTTSATILERSYIPQDAHSWGKEYPTYNSSGNNISGYSIADYAPLSDPPSGFYHLFANTTLLCQSGYSSDPGCTYKGLPLLRVLTNTSYRVWNWLSIERPVASNTCTNSHTTCAVTGTSYYSSYPTTHDEFQTLVDTYATSGHLKTATANVSSKTINATGSGDHYLTIFSGTLQILTSANGGVTGTYTFAVDGQDAVEVLIDGAVVASYYGSHSTCSCTTHTGTITLTAGQSYTVEFRQQTIAGSGSYYLYWAKPGSTTFAIVPKYVSSGGSKTSGFSSLTKTVYNLTDTVTSTLTDQVVRVEACVSGLLESECQEYVDSTTSE